MDESTRMLVGYAFIYVVIFTPIWFFLWWVEDKDWKLPTLVLAAATAGTALLYFLFALVDAWVKHG